MTKSEKQDHLNNNIVPDLTLQPAFRTLKDNPDGETICHADFSDGCVNEDTDPSAITGGNH